MMLRLRFTLAVLLLTLGAPAAAAVAPDVAASAQKEGTVVWYSTLTVSNLAALAKRFEELHPGIRVRTLRLGSSQLPARIVTERRAWAYNVDVISGDDSQFAELLSIGALQKNPNPEASHFLRGTVDPNGMWTNLYLMTTVFAFNPQRLKSAGLQPPRALADFAKPQYRGLIGIDASALNWYTGTLQADPNADALMKRIAANKPIMTEGHSATVSALEAGEFDVTPTAYGYLADADKRAGKSVDFVNPTPTLVTLNPIGLAKNAPHPNAGRLLIDWVLSRDGQRFIAEHAGGYVSSRTDVIVNPAVFTPKMPIVIVRPPDPSQYDQLVGAFKAIFGIAS